LLLGGGVVEPLDGSLLQPTMTMVADMTAMVMAFFIKRDAANGERSHAGPMAPGKQEGDIPALADATGLN
jgi:hypothetical protein